MEAMEAATDQSDSFVAMLARGPWLGFLPRRFREPAVLLLAYGILTLLALLAAPLTDRAGGESLDAAFKRAVGALAATRGLDSAISLAQSSEVSFSFGPGGSLGIGQVLDPVNDLVEQYGNLLLASTTALGIQQLGMRMAKSLGWWLFAPALVALALATGVHGQARATLQWWGRRLFALALFARLAIPVTAWVDAAIAARFLEDDYQKAAATVQATTENLEQVEAADTDKPWYERYNPVNIVGDRARQLSAALGDVAESIVSLVIYFSISTIALPLATLWLLSRAVTALVTPRGG